MLREAQPDRDRVVDCDSIFDDYVMDAESPLGCTMRSRLTASKPVSVRLAVDALLLRAGLSTRISTYREPDGSS
jgi:hypothetical protein